VSICWHSLKPWNIIVFKHKAHVAFCVLKDYNADPTSNQTVTGHIMFNGTYYCQVFNRNTWNKAKEMGLCCSVLLHSFLWLAYMGSVFQKKDHINGLVALYICNKNTTSPLWDFHQFYRIKRPPNLTFSRLNFRSIHPFIWYVNWLKDRGLSPFRETPPQLSTTSANPHPFTSVCL